MLRPKFRFLSVTAAALVLATLPAVPATRAAAVPVPAERDVQLAGGGDATVLIFPAEGRRRMVWLLNDHGRHSGVNRLAGELARAGVEVWVVDLLAANFLAPVKSSLLEIAPEQIAELYRLASGDGHDVYGFASGRGAVLAAGGAVAQAPESATVRLKGLVLISPNLYVETPEPGAEAEYLPVASRLAVPVFIIQPELSPWRWWIDRLSDRLRAGGSAVRYVILPGVRGRFEFRPDGTAREEEIARQLPAMILDALTFLDAPNEEAR